MTEEKTCGNGECGSCDISKCGCKIATPILVILFGLVFLLNTTGIISDYALSMAWPIIIILIGVAKLIKKMCNKCA